MRPQEIIRKKRDGVALSADEIAAFIDAATKGEASEGQIGAFTMAVYLRGMDARETVALSLAMRDSGKVLIFRLRLLDAITACCFDPHGAVCSLHDPPFPAECVSAAYGFAHSQRCRMLEDQRNKLAGLTAFTHTGEKYPRPALFHAYWHRIDIQSALIEQKLHCESHGFGRHIVNVAAQLGYFLIIRAGFSPEYTDAIYAFKLLAPHPAAGFAELHNRHIPKF